MKDQIHKAIMINDYNNNISRELPDGAEVCAHCNKAQIVPLTSQTNYLSMSIVHHYGSPKDGDVEEYDICFPCYDKIIKTKNKPVSNYLSNFC